MGLPRRRCVMADGKERGIVVKNIENLMIKKNVAANAGLGNLSADLAYNGFTQTVVPIIGAPGTIVSTNAWANFILNP